MRLFFQSKDIRLEIPIDIIHPRAMPPSNELVGIFATPNLIPPTSTGEEAVPPSNHYYNPAQVQPPIPVPYVDPAHNQVWLPPPAGYTAYPDMYHAHPQAAYPHFQHHQQQPYYGTTSPPPLHAMSPAPIAPHVTGLGLTLGMPYSAPMPTVSPIPLNISPAPPVPTLLTQPAAAPRPLSAGPVASASQLPQSMVPGLPAPEVSPVGLLPFPVGIPSSPVISGQYRPFDQNPQSPTSPSAMGYTPEKGKGERALRVSRHLKLSSRNRSVSPLSHRHPLPQPPHPILSEEDGLHNASASPQGRRTRLLPLPPGEPLHPAPGVVISPLLFPGVDQSQAAVVHSPRPQLTPKQSFNHGYFQAKSERVEELEKMADVVVRRSGDDLSADVPKGVVERVEQEIRAREREKEKAETQGLVGGTNLQLKRNKTLPGPPIEAAVIQETEPLPSDQTPPTPTLQALSMRKRDKDKDKTRERLQELRTENGLDALERRLLKEVGTRKMNAPPRPDVRSVLSANLTRSPLPPLDTGDLASLSLAEPMGGGSLPIPIPLKSPEPLNESAISSLTLAGCMADDDSDGGRTHRAESRSRGGWDGGQNGDGLHRHMRERAEVNGRTPPKTPDWDSPAEEGQDKERTSKESKSSNRKKHKTAATKGRVAAWLGRIDINAPPQEQIIPPSPSVVRAPDQLLELPHEEGEGGPNGLPWQFDGMLSNEKDMARESAADNEREEEEDVVVAPNPRSSGFVPIGTLNRNTIQFNLGPSQPLFLRDATIVEEAKRVQALWSSASPLPHAPALESGSTPTQQAKAPGLKFPMLIPPLPRMQSIRTDRRVSPPSTKPMPSVPEAKRKGQEAGEVQTKPVPMSYSAVAKSARKQVGQSAVVIGSSVGGGALRPMRVQPFEANNSNKPLPSGRLPLFPPKPPVDPEVKYDIRSARGGRGGKVTAVANLWASGAITEQATTDHTKVKLNTVEAGKVKEVTQKGNEFMQRVVEEKQKMVQDEMKAKPEASSKDTKLMLKTDKKLFSAALMTPAPAGRPGGVKALGVTKPMPPSTAPKPAIVPNSSPSRPAAAGPSKPLLEAQKRPDSRPTFQDPASLKPPTVPLQKRPAMAMSNPGPARGRQTASGKSTPMLTSLSTPPSPGSKPPDVAPKGGLKTMPAIVPTLTNPATAVVSSSHAVPHLSSTASLARPHPPSSVTTHAPRATNVKFPALLSASISAPSLVTPRSTKTPPPPPSSQSSSNKLSDLSFGQARLRDLIKKYQTQGT